MLYFSIRFYNSPSFGHMNRDESFLRFLVEQVGDAASRRGWGVGVGTEEAGGISGDDSQPNVLVDRYPVIGFIVIFLLVE